MTLVTVESPTVPPTSLRRPEWAPRIWEGCDFFAWLRLLLRNRVAVHPSCWYIAAIITVVSFFHTVLRHLQEAWYGEQVARTPIREAPLFIIGHWRTGTTLLHEFLILDERHTYPNTYECFEPNHFLLTERLITRWLHFLMPSRRPMDNMAAGWERPQEDEFALCMMGQPSPYLTVAFPNHPPQYPEFLDLEGVPSRARAAWKQAFYRFLQCLTFKNPKRLILKSPPHSCRIKVLLELFPDARFVHILRDPYVVFPSTVNLWKSLYRTHGLQRPTFQGLEEQVFDTFLRLYARLEEGRKLVHPGRFYELRYEDLIRDPLGEMNALYDHLELGAFDRVRPQLERYVASLKGYETNRYEIPPQLRAEIGRRWGPVIQRYGYRLDPESGDPLKDGGNALAGPDAHGR
ncbi:MAG: sulfotransferase [Gemmataceae bacterium]|nr:sulfotransferase [Gemmataceae bacterium]